LVVFAVEAPAAEREAAERGARAAERAVATRPARAVAGAAAAGAPPLTPP
jgi:hypothetical protein